MLVPSSKLYADARIDQVEQALIRMERTGFRLDSEFCREAAGRATSQRDECLERLNAWGRSVTSLPEDFNWASPMQLIGLFHTKLGLAPSPVWKKGRVKVDDGDRKLDETALDWIRAHSDRRVYEGIDELIRLRRLTGAIKYLTKLPLAVAPDGLVHPICGPSSDADDRPGTITWRLATKKPETQQIPNDPKKDWFRIRKAFIARQEHICLVADESALEVVILGHLLIKLFDDHQLADMVAPGAPDIHSVNARLVFGTYLKWERHGRRVDKFPLEAFKDPQYPELCQLRQDIKAVWYGLMYGKTAYGFATSLRDAQGNAIGEDAASAIVDALFAAIPGIPRYQGFIGDYVIKYGGIPGLGGAWCDLGIYLRDGEWGVKRAIRIGQNYPMQEGGARIIGRAMVDIMNDPWLNEQGLLTERQVHDELDFNIPGTADIVAVKDRIKYHMTSYPLLSHLQVKIGQGANWDAAKT